MGNSAYLCMTNERAIYPSSTQNSYSSHEQTLAYDVYCVPLLWLALFRSEDMEDYVVEAKGHKIPLFAPIADKEKAVSQLMAAVPCLDAIFGGQGSVESHALMLKKLIEDCPYRYITIEWDEIEEMTEDGHFRAQVKAALDGIERRKGDKKALWSITSIERRSKIPSIPKVQTGQWLPKGEIRNLTRVLGGRLYRDVPWEVKMTGREPLLSRILHHEWLPALWFIVPMAGLGVFIGSFHSVLGGFVGALIGAGAALALIGIACLIGKWFNSGTKLANWTWNGCLVGVVACVALAILGRAVVFLLDVAKAVFR